MIVWRGKHHKEFTMCAAAAALLSACAPLDGARPLESARPEADPCMTLGNWIEPGRGNVLDAGTLLSDMSVRPVVLLGESHTNPEDHRWQYQSLVALHTLNPSMVVGFEMFPRAKQGVLDRWVAGELDEAAFLDEVEWNRVWGYDPQLYLPLLRFVRLNRVPAVALNVDRALVSRVGRDGWESVPEGAREGLGDPAPASEDYRESLSEVYAYKQPGVPHGSDRAGHQADFDRFVEAQLTWDRAMAEALIEGRDRHGAQLAVGVMGRGHVESGHGVAHQLADQGVGNTGVLLPVGIGEGCAGPQRGLADALFTVPEWQPGAERRPTLGVYLEDGDDGVRVVEVVPDSVAKTAGLRTGDRILMAAGGSIAERTQLIETIGRQAPGTWLPLTVRRDGRVLDVVAKFPPAGAEL